MSKEHELEYTCFSSKEKPSTCAYCRDIISVSYVQIQDKNLNDEQWYTENKIIRVN